MGSADQTGASPDSPALRPPGAPPATGATAAGAYRWVWMALAAVVLLGLGVIFVLPQLMSERAVPEPERRVEAAARQAPPGVSEPDGARTQAEQALQQFLQLQAQLELVNAAIWGEPAWSEAATTAAAGDRLFGERRFAEAAETYSGALARLRALQDNRERLLADALDAAQRALRDDDADTALVQFEVALAIEPGHALAAHGLARARVRTDVLELMAAGNTAEQNSDLEAAQAAYLQATQLDSEYQPASEHLARVAAQLTDSRFRAAMSRALVALDAGQLQEAGDALGVAAGLKPADVALRDVRRRLTVARQQATLSGLRRRASAALKKEDWQAAVALYKKALGVDANAGFARAGLGHAQDRVQLHKQFDHYLADPTRLYSAEPLANAEQLLAVAGQAPAGEPRLAEKIRRLQAAVRDARRPLPVTLRSDGETEVVIYHVGRLGRFLNHDLELRPGTYTALGSRAGYRDVRAEFTVRPGQVPPPVDIRCEEPV